MVLSLIISIMSLVLNGFMSCDTWNCHTSLAHSAQQIELFSTANTMESDGSWLFQLDQQNPSGKYFCIQNTQKSLSDYHSRLTKQGLIIAVEITAPNNLYLTKIPTSESTELPS